MSRIQISLCVVVLLLVGEPTFAARSIRMQIKQDGKVVLESSWGDNGRADADEVWLYLKKVRFAPEKSFEVDSGAKEVTLENVEIDVQYGGMSRARNLRLTRKPDPKAKPGSIREKQVWAISDKDIRVHFNGRYVRRADVGRIKNPNRRLSKGELSKP